jgi:hypothetical protein
MLDAASFDAFCWTSNALVMITANIIYRYLRNIRRGSFFFLKTLFSLMPQYLTQFGTECLQVTTNQFRFTVLRLFKIFIFPADGFVSKIR